MKYHFTIPYEQTQLVKSSGLFNCEIEAESEEEALAIFEQNAFGFVREDNIIIDVQEFSLEEIESYDYIYDTNKVEFED